MKQVEELKELAEDIMLELTETEINLILTTKDSINSKFKKVTSIDTENVEPMFYPFDDSHIFLREDEDIKVVNQKAVLDNAPTTDGDYITIVKVVN